MRHIAYIATLASLIGLAAGYPRYIGFCALGFVLATGAWFYTSLRGRGHTQNRANVPGVVDVVPGDISFPMVGAAPHGPADSCADLAHGGLDCGHSADGSHS